MRSRFVFFLSSFLMILVLAGGLYATRQQQTDQTAIATETDATPNSTAAAGTGVLAQAGAVSDNSEGRVEYLGPPPGPYDPVLTQGVDPGLALPPTNRRCNNPAGEPVSSTQAETWIAVQGNNVVAGWNDAIGFTGPQSISGYGYSTNRGDTWVDGGGIPEGNQTAVWGDPAIAVCNDGTWIFASLDQGSPNGIAFNRGTFNNGVLTFGNAVKWTDGNQFLDKEAIDYDPVTNRVYVTYTNFGTNQGRIIRSTDSGLTWSAPVTVGSVGTGYYPCAGIDGEVYVSYGALYLYCRYSPDGGQTFNAQVRVKTLDNTADDNPQCFNRGRNMTWPAMAVDRSNGPHRGRAYFVYTNGGPGNFDTYLVYSDDKGAHWSQEVKLNDEQNASEQFFVQVTCGPDGRVTAGWYDRRKATNNNSLCDMYITQSVDGGVTWGPNRRLSDVSAAWCGVPADAQPNFGDYIEMTCDDKSVFGCWCDGRGGGPDVWMARFDDRQVMAVSGNIGQEAALFGATGTAWLICNEAETVANPAPPVDAPPQFLVTALAQSLLATPPETQGLFKLAGDAISGSVNMSSSLGPVNGTFGISRADVNNLNFDFTSRSANGLHGLDYLNTAQIHATLVPAGPGQVNIYGTVTMDRTSGPLNFSLGGTIHLDGAPGQTLAANQSIDATVRIDVGGSLVVHTRTTVVDGVTVDVAPLSVGANPAPAATIRAVPNPARPNASRIVFTLTHAATGAVNIHSVDGRVVRTLASGTFEPGTHEIPFDGKGDDGRDLSRSAYFLHLDTDVVQAVGKLSIVD